MENNMYSFLLIHLFVALVFRNFCCVLQTYQ